MSKFAHLVNKDGILVYSQIVREFIQLAHTNCFTNLTIQGWCDGIAMPVEEYAAKIVIGRVPLTAKDLTGICTFCGTSVSELLDEVSDMGREVDKEGILTFKWDMEEVRKSFEDDSNVGNN